MRLQQQNQDQQLSLFPNLQVQQQAQNRILSTSYSPAVPNSKKVITSLFPDQLECVNQLKQHIAEGQQRTLLIAICGNGKTVMAGWTARDYMKQGDRCLFVTPYTSLISQATGDFQALGIKSTVLRGKQKYNKNGQMIVASLDTLARRLQKYPPEYVLGEGMQRIFIDEAHYSSYRKGMIRLHDYYLERGASLIGLTGTPWRTKPDEHLGQWYDVTVEGLQPPELIKLGRAVQSRIFGDSEIFDLDALDLDDDGDYRKDQITQQALFGNNLQRVVDKYKQFCCGDFGYKRAAIAFCATVEQAQALTQTFRNSGFKADWVVGDTEDGDRNRHFQAIETGDLDILVSVGCLSVGFDKRNISAVLFVRPTKSKSLWHQSVARAGRTFPGKYDYYILDFGGNAKPLGSPSDYLDFSIGPKYTGFMNADDEPKPKKRSSSPGDEAPVFDDEPEPEELHFVEIFVGLDRKKVRFFRQQKRLCFEENVSPVVAVEKFQAEYGHLPPNEWHLHAVLGKQSTKKKRQEFEEYIDRFAPHDYWAKVQKGLEFGEIEPVKKGKVKQALSR